MKLIKEFTSINDLEVLKEDGEQIGCHNSPKAQKYYIKGPFMTAEAKNLNERIYPRKVMEKAVKVYNEEYVKKNRAISECDHPSDATVNLKNASHIITELGFKDEKDNHVYGKARILDEMYFPMAKIAIGYLKEGIILGISSRGVGSLNNGIVGDDFTIVACDLVLSPSGPGCFLEGVLESKEFVKEGNLIVECAVQNLRDKVDKKYDKKNNLKYFMDFLQDIQVNKGK
jgi:hypothetical protein